MRSSARATSASTSSSADGFGLTGRGACRRFGFAGGGGGGADRRLAVLRARVVGEPTGIGGDAAIFDRQQPPRDRVEQRAVVGDEQDRARKGLERGFERLARLEVEMVRRLVQHEEVCPRCDDDRERQAPALAARQRDDRLLVVVPAREEKPPEQRLRLRAAQTGAGHCGVEHRAAFVELGLVLREVRRNDAVPQPHAAGGRRQPAQNRLEQRRLAGPVRADERHVLAALDRERALVDERFVARGHDEPLRDDNVASGPRRLQELEPERPAAPIGRLDAIRLDAVELLELRLGLPRLRRLVAEALDEPFEPGDLLRLALRLLLLVNRPGRLLEPPHVPRAGKERRASLVELEHCRRDGLQEPAVVRDEDNGGVDCSEHLLQPLERLDVEVVGRLVEQEQIRLRGQRARQRRARQLAAREGVQRPPEVGVRESEAAHDRCRPVAPVVPAGVLEPGLRGGVASEGRGVVHAVCHAALERAQFLLDCREVGRAGEHVLPQWQPAERRRPLVVQRDPRAPLESELAALERRLTGDRAQQRRLPGAVRAGERQAVAALDLERDAVEQRISGQLLPERRGD